MLNMHEKVYKTLLASNIDTLPINVTRLKIPGLKWAIIAKSAAKKKGILAGTFLLEYAEKHSSFVVDCQNGYCMIILEDFLSMETRMNHAAHEIAHIILEHTSLNGIIGKAKDGDIENRQEREANDFARLLLAPPCILVDNGIYDFENIMKFTGVSEEHAKQIVGEIQQYRRTMKTQTEKELCKKFNTQGYQKTQRFKTFIPSVMTIQGGVS